MLISRRLVIVAVVVWVSSIGPNKANAQLHENNFYGAKARTDFDQFNEGTSSNLLTLGSCPYNQANDPILIKVHPTQVCPTGPRQYSQSNFWDHNNGRYSSEFWVVHANNEKSFSNQNSGPPGQSEPIGSVQPFSYTPCTTLFGLDFAPNPSGPGNRAHLCINQDQNPSGVNAASPFISVGANRDRGNGGVLATLRNGTQWRLTWRSRLSRFRGSVGFHYLWLEAEWGGKKRGLFVQLMHQGTELPQGKVHRHWNWPIKESFLFPGKDWAFYDVEDIPSGCGFTGQRLVTNNQLESYTVDPAKLFTCAVAAGLFDDPVSFLTSYNIPLTGAHWGIEMAAGYPGLLHVAVDQPKIEQIWP